MNRRNKAILCILPIIILSSCAGKNSIEDTRNYSDYDSHVISLDDFYKQDGYYAVYIYRETCGDCAPIKGEVLDYLDAFDAGNKKTFASFNLVALSTYGTPTGTIERAKFKDKGDSFDSDDKAQVKLLIAEMDRNMPSSLSETYFFGTPSLYIIKDNRYQSLLLGADEIPNYLSTH